MSDVKAYKAKLSDFTPLEHNPNQHTERGQYALETSIEKVGYLDSMTASEDGVILSGNLRSEIAGEKLGDEVIVIETDGTIPVIHKRTDLASGSPEARLAAVTANRVAEVSLQWDAEELAKLALDDDIDLSAFFRDDELIALGVVEPEPLPTAPEAQTDKAEELRQKWQTELGQVWEIPSKSVQGKAHRVICGDCTDADVVARVMDGEKAGLFAADPPYGVSLRLEDNHEASNAAKGVLKTYRHFEKISGDDLEGEKLQSFLESVFGLWKLFLSPDAAWYLWHAQMSQGFFAAAAAAAADLLIHRQIIWAKPHFVFGRGDYHWQHELCFYGWVTGNRPPFYGERNQSTVWQSDIGGGSIRKDQSHPTEKPTVLFEIPMRNHLKIGGLAVDPFLGSGTTMVAAERTGRICYGCEIEPRYTAVILQRMADLGLEPRLDPS